MTALLERPATVVQLGPNWFASVMGTGIVATAAASLPVHLPGLRAVATLVWAVAAVLLIVLIVAAIRHLRPNLDDPVMTQFWGAPPMALLTVGSGTLLLGRDWIGTAAAVDIDLVLWTAGTVLGLVSAVAVPYLMMTRHTVGPDAAFGGWLMPVVPPMVSAASGALLVPYVGNPRELLLACYALFGITLFAAVLVIGQLWGRLVTHHTGAARMVPTLWIVLGPIGQSVTAAHLLGNAAQGVLPPAYAQATEAFALLYGVPALGFGLFWMALAAAITVRTARAGLPFSLTWWSFTFPVGTMVTGLSGIAARAGAGSVAVLAVLLYAVLVAAWAVVAARTVRGARRGSLLRVVPPA